MGPQLASDDFLSASPPPASPTSNFPYPPGYRKKTHHFLDCEPSVRIGNLGDGLNFTLGLLDQMPDLEVGLDTLGEVYRTVEERHNRPRSRSTSSETLADTNNHPLHLSVDKPLAYPPDHSNSSFTLGANAFQPQPQPQPSAAYPSFPQSARSSTDNTDSSRFTDPQWSSGADLAASAVGLNLGVSDQVYQPVALAPHYTHNNQSTEAFNAYTFPPSFQSNNHAVASSSPSPYSATSSHSPYGSVSSKDPTSRDSPGLGLKRASPEGETHDHYGSFPDVSEQFDHPHLKHPTSAAYNSSLMLRSASPSLRKKPKFDVPHPQQAQLQHAAMSLAAAGASQQPQPLPFSLESASSSSFYPPASQQVSQMYNSTFQPMALLQEPVSNATMDFYGAPADQSSLAGWDTIPEGVVAPGPQQDWVNPSTIYLPNESGSPTSQQGDRNGGSGVSALGMAGLQQSRPTPHRRMSGTAVHHPLQAQGNRAGFGPGQYAAQPGSEAYPVLYRSASSSNMVGLPASAMSQAPLGYNPPHSRQAGSAANQPRRSFTQHPNLSGTIVLGAAPGGAGSGGHVVGSNQQMHQRRSLPTGPYPQHQQQRRTTPPSSSAYMT